MLKQLADDVSVYYKGGNQKNVQILLYNVVPSHSTP